MVVNLACYATHCIVRSPYECVYSRSHNFLKRRPKSRKLQQNMCEGMYVNIIDSFCHSDHFEKMTPCNRNVHNTVAKPYSYFLFTPTTRWEI